MNVCGAEQPVESESIWDKSITLRGAVGYKDNVLLNKFIKDSSAFWLSSIDLFAVREPEHGTHLALYGSFEDRRYFSISVNKEEFATTMATVTQDVGELWQTGISLQYVYLDQVLDVSLTEEIFASIPVRAHTLRGIPFVLRKLPWNARVELRFEVERDIFDEPLDDFWQGGPKLMLGKNYGNRSDLFISYQIRERSYDTRRQFSLDFSSLPDTSLSFEQQEIEAGIKHNFDKERHWRSALKTSFEMNRDNGPGFFDYDRYRVALDFGYYAPKWQARAQGKMLRYDYRVQPLFFEPDKTRNRWEWVLNLRLQRQIAKGLNIFAETEHEWVESNESLDQYQANTYMGGIDWEF